MSAANTDHANQTGLHFRVAGRIARPVAEVFEAVVDPEQLSHYFTTGGAVGRLETGATVQWDFADFPGAFPVEVVEVDTPRRIVLRWAAAAGSAVDGSNSTTVTMEFEPLDGDRTLVTIAEEGWAANEAGRTASYRNCEGWTNAICCLKAWIEHGVRLRSGFYS